jgi:hypothetical protein
VEIVDKTPARLSTLSALTCVRLKEDQHVVRRLVLSLGRPTGVLNSPRVSTASSKCQHCLIRKYPGSSRNPTATVEKSLEIQGWH